MFGFLSLFGRVRGGSGNGRRFGCQAQDDTTSGRTGKGVTAKAVHRPPVYVGAIKRIRSGSEGILIAPSCVEAMGRDGEHLALSRAHIHSNRDHCLCLEYCASYSGDEQQASTLPTAFDLTFDLPEAQSGRGAGMRSIPNLARNAQRQEVAQNQTLAINIFSEELNMSERSNPVSYYHGKPCGRCGNTVRLTSSRSCRSCNIEARRRRRKERDASGEIGSERRKSWVDYDVPNPMMNAALRARSWI